MHSAEYRKQSAEMPHRRTVRIVKRRLPSRTAAISLAITALAAACGFVAWRLWQADAGVVPYQRTLGDVLLTYRCPRGDDFQAKGQVTAINCPNCGRPAFPVATFACDAHHSQEVWVRFRTDSDGDPVVDQVRPLPNGEWTKLDEGLKCQRCGLPMTRVSEDTIDFNRLRPRDPEGGIRRSAPPGPADDSPRSDSGADRPLPEVRP